jgi:hypothetical protein
LVGPVPSDVELRHGNAKRTKIVRVISSRRISDTDRRAAIGGRGDVAPSIKPDIGFVLWPTRQKFQKKYAEVKIII